MKYTINELQQILGVSDDEICNRLRISKGTLRNHLNNDKSKYYKLMKAEFVHERAKLIKYLQ